MTSNLTEVIVKVGNKSQLSFSRTKAYRVITSEELAQVASFASDCHIVIIEYLDETEIETTRNFIKSFISKDERNRVWFYVPDTNDMVTTGLADELELDIFLNEDKLFRRIYEETGFIISTNLTLRKELIDNESSESPFDVDLKTDDNFSSLEPEEGIIKEEQKETKALSLQKENETSDITTKAVENIDKINTENKNIGEGSSKKEDTIIKLEKEEDKIESADNNSESADVYAPEDTKVDELDSLYENTDSEMLNADLIGKLKDAQNKNSTLTSTLLNANNRIKELSKLNKALREQYESVVENYNQLVESDIVIEDPISLEQYQSLEETIKKNNETIEDLQKLVDKLQMQIKSNEDTIAELNNEIEEKKSKLAKRKQEIEELNEKINSGELQAEALEESNIEIKKLKAEIEELNVQIKMQSKDCDKLRNTIDSNNEIIEVESTGRKTTLEFSNATIRQLIKLNEELVKLKEENQRHLEIIKNLKSSDAGNNEIISSQTAEILDLRRKLQDVEGQIEDAVANMRYEKTELSKQVASLQETVKEQNEQLQMKETLLSISGVDETGSNMLLENNKMLEDINKTLREQLRNAQRELEASSKEKALNKQSIDKLKETNMQLTRTLKSMTSTSFGGGMTSLTGIPPINYQGSGFIIPVIGSGSYGITTTAMSIARQLAQNSKVMYIDFDLVVPKADSWFKINPMCKTAQGYDPSDAKFSGLGIFFERGMDFLAQNINNIVFDTAKPNDVKMNGLLHYLSGAYTRVDAVKLLSADFSRFLTYLGSNYNYIIIDMGRLGSSEINDKVIKAITDIAYRTVAVTTPDILEIRNFKVKLTENRMKVDNIAWLVNMEGNISFDSKAMQFISPARVGKMPFYEELYGTKETYQAIGRQTRDKFMLFMNSVLFGSN